MKEIDWNSLVNTVTHAGLKIVVALIILIIAFKLINFLFKRLGKKLIESGRADKTVTNTLLHIGQIALKIVTVICLIGYLGIDTSGLSALVASLGVCVGLAVNGTLSNLAGGVMLLITRPFKADDYIEALGYAGTVEEVRVVTTVIRTNDNKLVYIPNGTLSTSSIVNYSAKQTRRVDLTFSISYADDFEKAKAALLKLCEEHSLVLSDPAPFARVSGHKDSCIELTLRAWCQAADYWTVYFDMLENAKTAFDNAGIEIPFPQVDVHMK